MKCHLFIEGSCDEICKKILVDCNWWDDFYTRFYFKNNCNDNY